MTNKNATIERLRVDSVAALKAAGERPTNEQVSVVVRGIDTCRSLSEVSAESGLTTESVLDVVADLGTWLTHSNKGAIRGEFILASELRQPLLFQEGTWRKKENPTVIVPVGFESKSGHKRDVNKALAAIVVARPDATTLARFVSRTYSVRSASMTYQMLSGVWYFAQSGRLDNIDKVNTRDPVFHTQAVAAYDLLEFARLDALAAIETLVSGARGDLDVLADACVKARWVSESEVTRIERLVQAAHGHSGARRALGTELRFFGSRVRANTRTYQISSIAELSIGQIQRIATMSGLSVTGSSRVEEAEIRNKLKKMGLSNDIDRLVPEGLRAADSGQLVEFWSVMELRSKGDMSWVEGLSSLFDKVDA